MDRARAQLVPGQGLARCELAGSTASGLGLSRGPAGLLHLGPRQGVLRCPWLAVVQLAAEGAGKKKDGVRGSGQGGSLQCRITISAEVRLSNLRSVI